jgi:hypothetical protein
MSTEAAPNVPRREPVAAAPATAMRLPRTTGALSGLLVMILGAWGALIPLIGPWFHYAFGNYQAWHVTSNRIWLDIVPGAVAFIGGWMLLTSSRRTSGLIGGWLGVLAGAWFAIGPAASLLWHKAGDPIGAPTGGHIRQAIEWLGYFTGLGVLIASLAAFAMGRYFSRPRIAEEPMVAAAGATAVAAEERPRRRFGLFGRRRRAAATADPAD